MVSGILADWKTVPASRETERLQRLHSKRRRAQTAAAAGDAGGAVEAAGPADATQRGLAPGFGAAAVEEGREAEAFLELDLVLGPEGAGGGIRWIYQ